MVDVLKLRFHECSNVGRPNSVVLVTTMENKNWEIWFISNGKYENWENCDIKIVIFSRFEFGHWNSVWTNTMRLNIYNEYNDLRCLGLSFLCWPCVHLNEILSCLLLYFSFPAFYIHMFGTLALLATISMV